MAEEHRSPDSSGPIETNPVVVVQEIGQKGRGFLREIGGIFWFIIQTVADCFRFTAGRGAGHVSFNRTGNCDCSSHDISVPS